MNYSDDQLRDALTTAVEGVGLSINAGPDEGEWYPYEVESLRRILAALPGPDLVTDEWEQCEFDDIREGDRVRLVQAGRTMDFHYPVAEVHQKYVVMQDQTQCSHYHWGTFYRIPAPVTHPDPERHPYILVSGYKDHTDDGILLDEPVPYFWDGGWYDAPHMFVLRPTDITEWVPAKVVADEDH